MKPHSLFRLTQKLYSTPHLLSRKSFDSISSYLTSRNTNLMMLPQVEAPEVEQEPDDLDDINGVGIITVQGPLTNRETGWESLCGGCSYESIIEQADDYIDAGATCIILSMDSGGGEAYGIFLAAQQLRAMCDKAGIPLIGYIDGCCASACYALGCVCDELIANPYADVGSIGVLVALCDDSEAMKKDGMKPIYISAGAEKIPYAADGSFRQEFLDDLQAKVDTLYEAFCAHVSEYTGLSVEDIKATEAKVYMAQEALSKGLVNKIMSNVDFVSYVASIQRGVVSNEESV